MPRPMLTVLKAGVIFGVGAESNGNKTFPGDIDDLRLYDVALTDEDVLAIYNQGMGDLTESLPFPNHRSVQGK